MKKTVFVVLLTFLFSNYGFGAFNQKLEILKVDSNVKFPQQTILETLKQDNNEHFIDNCFEKIHPDLAKTNFLPMQEKMLNGLREQERFYCAQQVDDEGFKNNVLHTYKNSLFIRILNLKGQNKITDASLAFAAQHFPGLVGVNLASCTSITEKGVFSLICGCPDLEKIKYPNGVVYVVNRAALTSYNNLREKRLVIA